MQDADKTHGRVATSRPRSPKLIVRKNFATFVTKKHMGLYSFQTYKSFHQEGFKPRRDLPAWQLANPVKWDANPFSDRNWQFQLNGWRCLDPILNEYFKTGGTRYLEEAILLAVNWWRYARKNSKAKFVWQDMATGLRAFRLALFLDRIFTKQIELPDDVVNALLQCAEQHIGKLQNERFIREGNHGVFQIFGLNLLAKVALGPGAYAACKEYCQRMFAYIIEAGYTNEGVHKEHSPTYHLFTTGRIKSFQSEALADPRVLELLDQADRVMPWLVEPNGRIVPIGDSADEASPLDGKVPLTTLQSGRQFAVADLTKSGYAIIRSDPSVRDQPSMLAMTGMWYSEMHKHNDELSFTLFEHGEPVFIDSGKYGYQYDDKRAYIVSAAGHNTVSFRDPAIEVGRPNRKGSFLNPITQEDDGFVIGGEVDREAFTHSRRLLYSPEQHLHIIDTVQGSPGAEYATSLHFSHELEPVLLPDGFEVRLRCGKLIRGTVEGADLLLARGETGPMLGWESVDYLKLAPASTVRAVFSDRKVAWRIDLN